MSLPVNVVLPDLMAALSAHSSVVLEAPPGAGKTTVVPPALLEQPWLAGKRILLLEPRRLAARNAAGYMAATLGEECGQRVGYRIRFDTRVGAATRIEVITEGILTRLLLQDPELRGVGLVIFDEFHERNLHSDLALALCLDVQQGLRDDLKLLVMSATLDSERIAGLLDAPVVRSQGRGYPVEIDYLPREPEGRIPEVMFSALRRILPQTQGDVLAFLPGAGEIRQVETLMAQVPDFSEIALYSLYGDLAFAEQERAILPDPQGRRKLVLATPIAETSLTIEGVAVVVDSGWQRVPRFDPRSGLTRLETVRVSRASAEQRAGRAGRLGPGRCYRLWSEGTQQGLIPHGTPEIREADLAPLVLELAQWGVSDAGQLQWLDPPAPGALAKGRELLQMLEALDEKGRITALGERMASLPLHPRLAHMLIRSEALELGSLACDVAALLGERDPLRRLEGERRCDFVLRIESLRAFRRRGNGGAREYGADPVACAAAERAARQWRKLLRLPVDNGAVEAGDVGLLLALAYPDRVARQRQQGSQRYLLASGRGAQLARGCSGAGELIVAASVGGSGGESRIYLAAPVEQERLLRHLERHLHWRRQVRWERQSGSVVAREEQCFGKLLLQHRALPSPQPDEVALAMLDGVREIGLDVLPWSDESRQLQARVCALRHWLPEEGWPDLSDEALYATLDEWLLPYLPGVSRREQLDGLDLLRILQGRIGQRLLQRLERAAPVSVTVPSGSRRPLRYSGDGEPPVLAVKLQELFGLAETPRVADGKVAVMLHLLSPAQRPLQVTRDLRSFWDNTYPEVKKEMKGRYPKHPWPDDPWNAVPTGGTHRRQQRS